ncbi:MAG: alanine racemase [Lachnospiraceae bacterium]|nr:alanine racemase [Lachnospiraceae bacterium]
MRQDYKRVYAQIDLDAIRYNILQMQNVIEPGTKILGVIKTDGYSHGAVPIAQELEPMEVMAGFAVATAEEALVLRRAGIKKPILILGYAFPYSYKDLIREEVRLTVFRRDMLGEISQAVEDLKEEGVDVKAKIHIKVDTGMSRIGIFPDEEGLLFVKDAVNTKGIEVEGIFTHFATADEKEKKDAFLQLDKFKAFLDLVKENGIHIPIKHCANSAAIIEMKQASMDMVRAGISLYGLYPSHEVNREALPLKPALSLYSHVIYLKEIKPGTAVSYGGTYIAQETRKVATIPVGYGDGYPRGLSGEGYVLIRGQKAPIIGRVCMDQFMVDVTHLNDVCEGDLVTLIGTDGEQTITLEELADIAKRLHYEFACDLGKRIPRVYMKNGEILSTKDYYQDF